MHESIAILVAVIIIIILVLVNKKSRTSERFTGISSVSEVTEADPSASWVRLYEEFNFRKERFIKYATKDQKLYYRILMPINLKSIDINVTPDSNIDAAKIRGVSIWCVYPGDVTASTVATGIYMDAYTDPAYAFRANSSKYKHVATVKPGEHLRMELQDPVKRIFMVINV